MSTIAIEVIGVIGVIALIPLIYLIWGALYAIKKENVYCARAKARSEEYRKMREKTNALGYVDEKDVERSAKKL